MSPEIIQQTIERWRSGNITRKDALVAAGVTSTSAFISGYLLRGITPSVDTKPTPLATPSITAGPKPDDRTKPTPFREGTPTVEEPLFTNKEVLEIAKDLKFHAGTIFEAEPDYREYTGFKGEDRPLPIFAPEGYTAQSDLERYAEITKAPINDLYVLTSMESLINKNVNPNPELDGAQGWFQVTGVGFINLYMNPYNSLDELFKDGNELKSKKLEVKNLKERVNPDVNAQYGSSAYLYWLYQAKELKLREFKARNPATARTMTNDKIVELIPHSILHIRALMGYNGGFGGMRLDLSDQSLQQLDDSDINSYLQTAMYAEIAHWYLIEGEFAKRLRKKGYSDSEIRKALFSPEIYARIEAIKKTPSSRKDYFLKLKKELSQKKLDPASVLYPEYQKALAEIKQSNDPKKYIPWAFHLQVAKSTHSNGSNYLLDQSRLNKTFTGWLSIDTTQVQRVDIKSEAPYLFWQREPRWATELVNNKWKVNKNWLIDGGYGGNTCGANAVASLLSLQGRPTTPREIFDVMIKSGYWHNESASAFFRRDIPPRNDLLSYLVDSYNYQFIRVHDGIDRLQPRKTYQQILEESDYWISKGFLGIGSSDTIIGDHIYTITKAYPEDKDYDFEVMDSWFPSHTKRAIRGDLVKDIDKGFYYLYFLKPK